MEGFQTSHSYFHTLAHLKIKNMKIPAIFLAFIFFSIALIAQDEDTLKSNLMDERKNAVYFAQDFILTFSVNYERIFPLHPGFRLAIRGGLGRDGGNKDNTAIAGLIFLYGRSKHYFEAAVAYQHPNLFENGGSDHPKLAIMAGYRYQAPKGFLLKVYPEFLPDIWPDEESWGSIPFLGFALGYSF